MLNLSNDSLSEKPLKNINQLANDGANIGAISSNTPHVVFEKIEKESKIPLIIITQSTVEKAKNKGYKRVLLTGTIFTMDNDFYQKEFEKENIECITPNNEDKQIIQNIIFPNLENGKVIKKDKLKFINIVEKILSREDY
ncbi:Aspartate racemase [Candidatus Methanobinarius endosymbioticus]|uniref:Aspartate racemase n=1 Tax=Candidatus Methanobinarius endosymbioticus TaxID=2006182 RepID=A0A366M7U0_9EURY|nr:Aspartate racemase [Candidatus Methanobinarius endosymbioticus]